MKSTSGHGSCLWLAEQSRPQKFLLSPVLCLLQWDMGVQRSGPWTDNSNARGRYSHPHCVQAIACRGRPGHPYSTMRRPCHPTWIIAGMCWQLDQKYSQQPPAIITCLDVICAPAWSRASVWTWNVNQQWSGIGRAIPQLSRIHPPPASWSQPSY